MAETPRNARTRPTQHARPFSRSSTPLAGRAHTFNDAVKTALETVQEAFGWAYGSYWSVDSKDNVLKFVLDRYW